MVLVLLMFTHDVQGYSSGTRYPTPDAVMVRASTREEVLKEWMKVVNSGKYRNPILKAWLPQRGLQG